MEQPNSLILEMQKGNEKAFSRIYALYSEATFGIINTIVTNEKVAEEVLQDVFVKVWNNADSYDVKKGRFFTWILNIARNAAIDSLRSKASKNAKKNLSASNFVNIMLDNDSLNQKTNSIGIKNFVDKLKYLFFSLQ